MTQHQGLSNSVLFHGTSYTMNVAEDEGWDFLFISFHWLAVWEFPDLLII